MPRGTDYTEEIGLSVCQLIITRKPLGHDCSFYSLRDACRELKIAESTVYYWLGEHPTFLEMYTRARESRADLIAEDIIQVADEEADANRARVRIDARKWWAGKVNPRKWGDKILGDPNNPVGQDVTGALAELTRRITRQDGPAKAGEDAGDT